MARCASPLPRLLAKPHPRSGNSADPHQQQEQRCGVDVESDTSRARHRSLRPLRSAGLNSGASVNAHLACPSTMRTRARRHGTTEPVPMRMEPPSMRPTHSSRARLSTRQQASLRRVRLGRVASGAIPRSEIRPDRRLWGDSGRYTSTRGRLSWPATTQRSRTGFPAWQRSRDARAGLAGLRGNTDAARPHERVAPARRPRPEARIDERARAARGARQRTSGCRLASNNRTGLRGSRLSANLNAICGRA